MRVFVGATPGLEALLKEELTPLLKHPKIRITGGKRGDGGVEISGLRKRDLWDVIAFSRIQEKTLMTIGGFKATNLGAFKRGLSQMNWAEYIPRSKDIPVVHATCKQSPLKNSSLLKEKLRTYLHERRLRGITGLHTGPLPDVYAHIEGSHVRVRQQSG